MKLSMKFKLKTNAQDKEALLATMFAYNAACNFVSQFAFQNKVFNNYALHHACYQQIRTEFHLPSQLAVSVMSKVADAYKTQIAKAQKEKRDISLCRFKKSGSVAYDSRILTYGFSSPIHGKENIVSIKTLNKRIKVQGCFWNKERLPFFQGEADLLYQKGEFYVSQSLSVPMPAKQNVSDYLGVDLGMVQIATDSDGTSYSGDVIKTKRQKYASHRARLQAKKTKNSRRRLKRIGDREARFRKDINHQISKALVEKAKHTSRGIALEKLQQFFDKIRVRKSQRADRSSWSFFQLRFFVQYKSDMVGIPVVLVDPKYTSQECSVCGYIDKGNRKTQSAFVCLSCGHSENADFNAAKNIKSRAIVNSPKRECKHSLDAASLRGLPQAATLCGSGH